MANASGDDVDALIKSNYLQQPSPFSWAQQFNQGQQQDSQLLSHMRNDLLKAQMQKEMQMTMNAQNQTAIKDREMTVAGVNNTAAMDRLKTTIEADNEVEPSLGEGVNSMATNVFRAMSPSMLRRFEKDHEVIGNNRKGSKMFYRKRDSNTPGRTPGSNDALLPK